jgi:hypothetical protein
MSSTTQKTRIGCEPMPPRRRREPSTVRNLPDQSRKPFAQALADLKAASGWGWRDFADQLNTYGGPWTFGYLNLLANGEKRVSPGEQLWALCHTAARATGIEATYFKEYREHLAAQRAAQKVSEVGLDAVLAALEKLGRRQP